MEPRAKLKRLADQLAELGQKQGTPAVVTDAKEAAAAITDYLDGSAPSLDHAFKVNRKRGGQKGSGTLIAAVQMAGDMWLDDKSWEKIAAALDREKGDVYKMCFETYRAEFLEHVINKRGA